MLKFAILILALLGASVFALDLKCQTPSPTKDDFCGYTYDAKMCGVSAFDPNLVCSETVYNAAKNVCPKISLSKDEFCETRCKPLSQIPDVCKVDSDCKIETTSFTATKTPKPTPTKSFSIAKPCYCVCMGCYGDKDQCDNLVKAGTFDSDDEDCYKFYFGYSEDAFADACSESRETATPTKTPKSSKTAKPTSKTAEPEESETNDASESASESETPETSEASATSTATATPKTPSRRPSSRSRPASRSPARRPSSRSSRTPSVDGSVSAAATIQISFVILAIIAFFF